MLLESRGDYDFAHRLNANLERIADELERANELRPKPAVPGTDWNAILAAFPDYARPEPERKTYKNPRFMLTEEGRILCRNREDASCLSEFLGIITGDVVYAKAVDQSDPEGSRWECMINTQGE